jgi:hypothetical protein
MHLPASARCLALTLLTCALTNPGQSAVSVTAHYLENFDALGTALPDGWGVWTNSTATGNGTAFTWSTAAIANNASASATTYFRNLPGASQAWSSGLSTGSDRALGWRAGDTPSRDGSITFTWANTSGWAFTDLSFDLFTPNASGTAATFNLEYQLGAAGTFTAFAGKSYTTVPVPLTSPSALTVTSIVLTTAELAPLNDQTGPITLRLNNSATSGSTFQTFALDNFSYAATSTIPEPATYPLIGGIGALALAFIRRHRPRPEKSSIRPQPRP